MLNDVIYLTMKNTANTILIRNDAQYQTSSVMMGGAPLNYAHLTPGFHFPPVRIPLQLAMVEEYLRSVHGGTLGRPEVLVIDGREAVPPTAAGVLAMRSLFNLVSLPEGSIHVSQEFRFKGLMAIGDTVICHAHVANKQERGSVRLLTMDIVITNEAGVEMMTGRTVMTVPPDD
jgi:hypothetical protein